MISHGNTAFVSFCLPDHLRLLAMSAQSSSCGCISCGQPVDEARGRHTCCICMRVPLHVTQNQPQSQRMDCTTFWCKFWGCTRLLPPQSLTPHTCAGMHECHPRAAHSAAGHAAADDGKHARKPAGGGSQHAQAAGVAHLLTVFIEQSRECRHSCNSQVFLTFFLVALVLACVLP